MKIAHRHGRPRPGGRPEGAFSLIEMIVVLAIIAILVAAIVIPMIKRLDRIASDREVASLRAMADAFRHRVVESRYIPDATDWAPYLAARLGWQLGAVTANERRSPRIYLIDPAMQIGDNSSPPNLPYTQPITGSMVTNGSGNVVAPISPRFLFLSSISYPLPTNLVSGIADTTGPYAFQNIWETPDGAVPAGWDWPGGSDLKVQRVDLSDRFVQVNLANNDSGDAYYAIDGIGTNTVPQGTLPPMYFFATSDLKLLDQSQVLEYSEILFQSVYYIHELGSWQARPYLGRGTGQPGPLDLQRAMNLFLKAPLNPYAKFGVEQSHIYDAMVAYMSNFIDWRNAGYPGEFDGGGTPPKNLSDSQSNLDTVTSHLISPR